MALGGAKRRRRRDLTYSFFPFLHLFSMEMILYFSWWRDRLSPSLL